jgi:DNA polymerase-3 subunit epsilon
MRFQTDVTRLAFVDLETTGATATSDCITEIGIVFVDCNGVTEWSTLVRPQKRIPPFIESLTGISNEMVASAPTFEEVADEILQRLEGYLFIAHNARFDHGFLKNAFKRLGVEFKPAVLCTVKLSRKLFPGFGRHNLDSLAERHRLTVVERHRALGDAQLIWQFWQAIRTTFSSDQIADAVDSLVARPSWPPHLDPGCLATMPERHGVYLFFGETDLPIYIGKANHLRRRVLSHFSGDHRSAKEMLLSQQVKRIEWIETGGETGALLQEALLVKKLLPIHNRQLRLNDEICAWRLVSQGDRFKLGLIGSDDLFFGMEENVYGPFASHRKARDALRALCDACQLCPALLGLEKVKAGKACFASQLKRCLGVCGGVESAATHLKRLMAAIGGWKMTVWPYSSAVAVPEGEWWHVVNRWNYLGSVAVNDVSGAARLANVDRPRFDRDVYQILKARLCMLKSELIILQDVEPIFPLVR